MSLPTTLLEAFAAACAEPSDPNFNRLLIELEKGQFEVLRLDDIQAEVDLVLLWARTCVMYTRYNRKHRIDDYTTNAIGIILTTDGTAERVLASTVHHDALAYLALSALANEKAGDSRWTHQGILKMLSVWTGGEFINDESMTVERLTDILYGPMVYALYRTDVEEDKFLPGWLCRQNVDAQGLARVQEKAQASPTVEIPQVLLLDDYPVR